MATKIRISTEITEALETVNPGDIVQSIKRGVIILVTETMDNGKSFNGMVLDRGDYSDWVEKDYDLAEKDYGRGFITSSFKRYLGSVTLDSF